MSQIKTGAIALLVMAALSAVTYAVGRSDGWNDHVVVCKSEQLAQQAANSEAARLAAKRLNEQAAALRVEHERLEDVLAQLDDAARDDDNGHQCGIGADSVWRLNAIR